MTVLKSATVESIPIRDLRVHERNVRKDVGELGELEASIRAQGILEPLIAVRQNGGYAVVAGSRRLAAAKRAQLVEVPVIVRDFTDAEAAAAALVENLQRKDLSALEEAEGYRAWLDLTKQTQRELAKAVGRDESTISNALRLLQAPKPVKDALAARNITAAHARVAMELRDPTLVTKLPLDKPTTVEALKEQVTRLNGNYDTSGPGAIEKAKAELEAVRKKHPKATIVWRARAGYYGEEVVSLPKALGHSPSIAGPIVDRGYVGAVSATRHAEVCDCDAHELIADVTWRERRRVLLFKTSRVCVKPANYKKAAKAPRARAGKKGTKKVSPAALAKREAEAAKKAADQEKQEQQQAESRVMREFRMVKGAPGRDGAPVLKRIGKSLPADAARASVLVYFIGADAALYEPREIAMAWERIVEMPAKKVAALASALLALRITREVARGRTYRAGGSDHLLNGVRSYFGLKVVTPKAKKGKR